MTSVKNKKVSATIAPAYIELAPAACSVVGLLLGLGVGVGAGDGFEG